MSGPGSGSELSRPRITVVGLGPAGASYLSREVAERISARRTLVRTRRHPAAEDMVGAASLDHHYEAADTFEEVYAAIVEELVLVARRHAPEEIVYAVPGSPLVAERTVELLRADARVDVTVVPALSFLDLAWERLGIDPLSEGVRLMDADQFAGQANGEAGPFLLAQCWSQSLLSEIKLSANVDEQADLPEVVLLHHLGLDDEQVVAVSWWDMDRAITPDHLTSLFIPRSGTPVIEGDMARLEELVRTLREQCPWDREQTHATLMPHLVEEAYEVLDALEEVGELEAPGEQGEQGELARSRPAGDGAFEHLQEELGDLLFQIVFHARLAEEQGRFTLADVARGVHAKLVHRHPHVFGAVDADTAAQVATNWEEIKKQEKGRPSVTDGIPNSLPALLLTTKLQRKALSVDSHALAVSDVQGMVAEVVARWRSVVPTETTQVDAPPASDAALVERLVGDLLFGLADLSRRMGIDPEQALRARTRAFRKSIVALEGGSATEED